VDAEGGLAMALLRIAANMTQPPFIPLQRVFPVLAVGFSTASSGSTPVVSPQTPPGSWHLCLGCEFTLIGDTVNVAARVEQLTKTTGDAILLTQQSVDASVSRPPALIDRGSHALKGKSAAVQVFGLHSPADAISG
jgi:hypothetical protein